jgi:hypothetical protein
MTDNNHIAQWALIIASLVVFIMDYVRKYINYSSCELSDIYVAPNGVLVGPSEWDFDDDEVDQNQRL